MPEGTGARNLIEPPINPADGELESDRGEARDQAVKAGADHRPGFAVELLELCKQTGHYPLPLEITRF